MSLQYYRALMNQSAAIPVGLVAEFDFTDISYYTFHGSGNVATIDDIYGLQTLTFADSQATFDNVNNWLSVTGSGNFNAPFAGDFSEFDIFFRTSPANKAEGDIIRADNGSSTNRWDIVKHPISSFRQISANSADSVNGNTSLSNFMLIDFSVFQTLNYQHDGTDLYYSKNSNTLSLAGTIPPPSDNPNIGSRDLAQARSLFSFAGNHKYLIFYNQNVSASERASINSRISV